MVGIRQVLGVLGMCGTTDLRHNGHLVLAAKADEELRGSLLDRRPYESIAKISIPIRVRVQVARIL
jgi:hypothetical protein